MTERRGVQFFAANGAGRARGASARGDQSATRAVCARTPPAVPHQHGETND